ncbi:MAG: hypothetical protein OEY11_02735 [Gammaproteobacteria bacterium]|nr:hypothetical protein [Gammaproteobacteria bacterium]
MKTFTTTVVFLLTAMLLTACGKDQMKDEADASSLIQQASQSFKDVNAVGFAWRDTEDMIKQAEVALIDNEIDEAVKLAKEALMQSKIAMQQYEMQKNAGPL